MLTDIRHNSNLQMPLVKKILEYLEPPIEEVQIPEEFPEETQE